jgi:hypothetical protein
MSVANYVTCPKGHKVFVIWSDERQSFGFTCDTCQEHSEVAVSVHGAVKVELVKKGRRA